MNPNAKHDLRSIFTVFLILGVAFIFFGKPSVGKSESKLSKNKLYTTKSAPQTLPPTELADFSAGCFWGVEEEFRKVPGVVATAVGFEGGHTKNPTYHEVCYENTGHAETVSVEFDPKVTSYEKLLMVFWNLHDPTTLNRQGPDVGDQYRSVVFYRNDKQKALALKTRDALQASGELTGKIVTEIVPASTFTQAEDYHQQYVEKGGRAGCVLRKRI